MARVELLDGPGTGRVTWGAGVAHDPDAVTAAHLGAALAEEIDPLSAEGRRLQVLAARMAQDARPEFEAWFEAGLLLRRARARLAEIAQTLI